LKNNVCKSDWFFKHKKIYEKELNKNKIRNNEERETENRGNNLFTLLIKLKI